MAVWGIAHSYREDMHPSAILLAARRRANLTQSELADRAEVSQSEISRYERGRSRPTFAMVERLVAAAGLRMEIDLVPEFVPVGSGTIGTAIQDEMEEVRRRPRTC